MKPYDAFDAIDPFAAAVRAFECLKGALATAEMAAMPHHDLEELIATRGRELLRLLFQAHLDLREQRERAQAGHGGIGPVRGADGKVRPHREPGHTRLLACVFGTVTVGRTAWRGKRMSSIHPADRALSLPAGLHSHGLRRLAVAEAVRGSFDQAKAAIDRRCGTDLGKRQAEQLVVAAAVDIDSFYRQRIPMPTSADTVLVLQFDGKGIVMVRR